MDYSLAKELKEAGFPQKYSGLFWSLEGTFTDPSEDIFQKYELSYAPTLEELIEACGDELALLVRGAEKRWFAQGFSEHGATNFLGATPTIAVAKLWLALNTN